MGIKFGGWVPNCYVLVDFNLVVAQADSQTAKFSGYTVSISGKILTGVQEVTLSSLAYPMITHTPLAAGNLPIGNSQQFHMLIIIIPCSLKFLRLKNFVDFTGQRTAAKNFSHEISSSKQMQGVAERWIMKILSVKFCF